MTAAQILYILAVLILGILAFITFIVAATILGLMVVETNQYPLVYPVGLYVLGLVGIIFLAQIIRALIDAPIFTTAWIKSNQEALIIALLILLVLIIIL
jgi:hypothetical protein